MKPGSRWNWKQILQTLIFTFIGIYSLSLGYRTQQRLSNSSKETVIEMEALPAISAPVNGKVTGKFIYESHCAACHDTGATNAPRLTDKSAWETRKRQGDSILLQHVIQGYNLMPPRGACLECSDTDLKAAVAYIVGNIP
jgi:cytochrome c5